MADSGRKFKSEYAAAGVVLGFLCCILFFRPITGVADNGDFARIMNSTGLQYVTNSSTDRYFGYVNRLYNAGFIMPFGGGYFTTELPIVLLAVFISRTFLNTGLFDIRFLAAIYTLIFTGAFFLAVRCIRKRSDFSGAVAALILIFAFCDTGYISYFNSLYGEPVSSVFLLLLAASALVLGSEEKPPTWALVLLGTGAIIFAGAKVQNSPAGLLAVLLLVSASRLRRDILWKRVSLLMAAFVMAVSLLCYTGVSNDIKICNKYQTVFYGVLRGSADPERDLGELGLDPSLAVLAGTNYFMEEYPVDIRTPEFKEMLSTKVSHFKILSFYLRHPGRLLQKLEYAAGNGFKLNQGVGNFERYPGIEYKQTTKAFSFWGDFKQNVFPHSLPFLAAIYLAAAGIILYEYIRNRRTPVRFTAELAGFILLTGMLQFVLPIIGDGDADLSKHLYLFNVSFDLLLVTGITYISLKIAAAIKYVRERRLMAKLGTE
ncbi:MAG TPA: hypothetical protein VHT96_12850 [Clostridia bacterium]|nr:hypothetical protein [Clostridia bacterium]